VWEKFKDVTGFVLSKCYQVISHKEESLEEVLEVEIKRTIDEASEYMLANHHWFSSSDKDDSFDQFVRRGRDMRMGNPNNSPTILPTSDWKGSPLNYLSFSIETRDGVDYFVNPLALSMGAALGMKVF